MKVVNRRSGTIEYRLNFVGIRVSSSSCQVIAKSRDNWATIGPYWDLPIEVPRSARELKGISDGLRLTAYQYDNEKPGSDLLDVLTQRIDFLKALRHSDAHTA